MTFEVFTSYQIRRILEALASCGGALHGPEYHQALHDVAIAFGIDLPPVELWRVVVEEDRC